ncbi:hypothetical protein NP233_g11235 [Leucocoprinus birnbaumii]|uniref:Uncharacterized protein n=1 Tax=Leucocoprinus birnbaumii TaxID=56174 RepID=A0AAD5VHR4_9AGAR|nr:hypothetical protein NP233_g11235 [Leucocoprinus birnbaumii]
MDIDISKIRASLVPIKKTLHGAEIVNQIETQRNDPKVQAKLNEDRAKDALQLVYPILATLTVDVVSKVDWAEDHFEEAKALIAQYLQSPAGARLEQDSTNISQLYTDNRQDVSEYQSDFSDFVEELAKADKQAQAELEARIEELNSQIDSNDSTTRPSDKIFKQARQIMGALMQIAGIPPWLTWIISKILEALGLNGAEEARQVLDRIFSQQQELKKEREDAQREIEKNNGQTSITNINNRLDSFAKEWAECHHDIVLILNEMQFAADSATKRSLITRLKLMGSSVQALVNGVDTYIRVIDQTPMGSDAARPNPYGGLIEEVKALDNSANRIDKAIERIRVVLSGLDANGYKDKGGRPIPKFQLLGSGIRSMLWGSRDVATPTDMYIQDFVKVIVPEVESIKTDDDLRRAKLNLAAFIKQIDYFKKKLNFKEAKDMGQKQYQNFSYLRRDIEEFMSTFHKFDQVDEVKVILESQRADIRDICSRLDHFSAIWGMMSYDAGLIHKQLNGVVGDKITLTAFTRRFSLMKNLCDMLGAASRLYASQINTSNTFQA